MQGTGARREMSDMGGNLSGIQTAPELAKEQMEGAASMPPSPAGGPEAAFAERAVYIEEGFALGSLPELPVEQEAAADDETAGRAIFMDKLSERLAFERMGTRLYEALINKCAALGTQPSGMTVDDLKEIHDEEHRHFTMLAEAVTQLGGDPTIQSPCADVSAVASMGIMQVLVDPRTTVPQCLQAMLTVELTDNASWELLIDIAQQLGHEQLVDQFSEALDNEQKHLMNVQSWLADGIMAQIG